MLRSPWVEILGGALGLAVILIVFVFVLPRIASYRDVWNAVRDLPWQSLVALLIATVFNLVTIAPPYMAVLPGLRFRSALTVTLATDAATYIAPGGPALGVGFSFAMLRGWGFPARAITVAIMLVTLWSNLVKAGGPIIALTLLAMEGGENPLLQTVAIVGSVLFIVFVSLTVAALVSERQARNVGDALASIASRALRLLRRKAVTWSGESFVRFRHDTIDVLRHRGFYLTLATLAGHLTLFALLAVCLRTLGVSADEVSLVEAFAAWSIVRLLGSIPITPGGLGIVEVALTGALIAFGGDDAEVVAAVLIYRFLATAPSLILGVALGATWRRHHPGWEQTPTEVA
jgi:uncharacterized protein (TIRG00374 family)